MNEQQSIKIKFTREFVSASPDFKVELPDGFDKMYFIAPENSQDILKSMITIKAYNFIPRYVIACVSNITMCSEILELNPHLDLSEYSVGISGEDFVHECMTIRFKVKLKNQI